MAVRIILWSPGQDECRVAQTSQWGNIENLGKWNLFIWVMFISFLSFLSIFLPFKTQNEWRPSVSEWTLPFSSCVTLVRPLTSMSFSFCLYKLDNYSHLIYCTVVILCIWKPFLNHKAQCTSKRVIIVLPFKKILSSPNILMTFRMWVRQWTSFPEFCKLAYREW